MNEGVVQQVLFVGVSMVMDAWNYHLAWRISVDLPHDPPFIPPVDPPKDRVA
ncbi:hypothetical protein [Aneurinibacillus uraniidurans]|uniref:hypothetical protein n=1 Tax=Aneurinibacillus uraniidurans TaxID=2966586 RepID=UPI0023492194|nr:hypothetical protein [Aneurinibacillus sp. B1]WCN38950.1 hypothetical protein PO771_06015 [Aneurinibacillus sp. B1]